MKFGCVWIVVLIHITIIHTSVKPLPVPHDEDNEHNLPQPQSDHQTSPDKASAHNADGDVISVRITSSVAIGRGKSKSNYTNTIIENKPKLDRITNVEHITHNPSSVAASEKIVVTDVPPDLMGANIEYIKQLNAKKEARALHYIEQAQPFQVNIKTHNYTSDTTAEESEKSPLEIPFNNHQKSDYNENIQLARAIPFVAKDLVNYNQPFTKQADDIRSGPRLTTVSFNIVHDNPNTNYNVPNQPYKEPTSPPSQQYFNELPKVYSEPAKVYSEPAKFYSEPSKVYSEPAKVYSEPAKVYSEPAKVYGEPSKFYSEPASLHLEPHRENDNWNSKLHSPVPTSMISTSTGAIQNPANGRGKNPDHAPEKNYEVDEKVSVLSDGRSHGVQETTTENGKVGYVVEGRQYRKYRVEERTPDGYIVGEYGVVRNEDGALRGVRYTADGEASPRLIYDALMKFLQLK